MLSSKNISAQQTAALSATTIAVIGSVSVLIFTRNWQIAAAALGILLFQAIR